MDNRSAQPPAVTVMIPTYNQVAALRECLRSVQEQDYPDLEILVGDDCSTDETPAFLAGINDSRVRVVRHPRNLGRVANYHALLHTYATGDWVLNLDGDDMFINSRGISTLVKYAERDRGVTMVVGRVVTVRTDYVRAALHAGSASQSGSPTPLFGIYVVEDYWRNDHGMKHAGVLYHRQSAVDMDFYRMDIISSDIESLLRLALRGSVVLVDAPIAAWRIHGGNESGSDDIESRLANLQLIDGVAEEYVRHAPPQTVRRWQRRMRRRMVYGTVIRLIRADRTTGIAPFIRHALPSMSERLRLRLSPKYLYHRIRGR